MPDLIIKPNSAVGDKLIIQDRAGGAVLTTADSGSTIINTALTATALDSPSIILTPTATASAPSGAEGKLYYDSDCHVVQSTTPYTQQLYTEEKIAKCIDVNTSTDAVCNNKCKPTFIG